MFATEICGSDFPLNALQVQIAYVCPHAHPIKYQHSEWFHQFMSHHRQKCIYKSGTLGKGSYLSKKTRLFNFLSNPLNSHFDW